MVEAEERLLYRSRWLGGLFIAGGLGDLLVVALPHWTGLRVAVCLLVAAAALLVGGLVSAFEDRLPTAAHPLIVAFGTALISIAVYGVGPSGVGVASVFYPLVGLYIGGMFSRKLVAAELAFVAASYALALMVQGHGVKAADWAAAVVVTCVVAGAVRVITSSHRHLALHDALTGLPNRRALDDGTRLLMAVATRRGFPLSVAMIDLDHFKAANAELGHQGADKLLVQIVARWKGSIRAEDLLARYGGDEFVLLLPDTDLASAMGVLQRLELHDLEWSAFSAGVATWDGDEDQSRLLERADAALFRAKSQGRGQVVADR